MDECPGVEESTVSFVRFARGAHMNRSVERNLAFAFGACLSRASRTLDNGAKRAIGGASFSVGAVDAEIFPAEIDCAPAGS